MQYCHHHHHHHQSE